MNGYIVYDIRGSLVEQDQWGHFKVYSNLKAAKRRASYLNNSVAGGMDRWSVKFVLTEFKEAA